MLVSPTTIIAKPGVLRVELLFFCGIRATLKQLCATVFKGRKPRPNQRVIIREGASYIRPCTASKRVFEQSAYRFVAFFSKTACVSKMSETTQGSTFCITADLFISVSSPPAPTVLLYQVDENARVLLNALVIA